MPELIGWEELSVCDGFGSWILHIPYGYYYINYFDESYLPEWYWGFYDEQTERHECATVAECMLAVAKDYEFRLREGMKQLAELQKKSLDNL